MPGFGCLKFVTSLFFLLIIPELPRDLYLLVFSVLCKPLVKRTVISLSATGPIPQTRILSILLVQVLRNNKD